MPNDPKPAAKLVDIPVPQFFDTGVYVVLREGVRHPKAGHVGKILKFSRGKTPIVVIFADGSSLSAADEHLRPATEAETARGVSEFPGAKFFLVGAIVVTTKALKDMAPDTRYVVIGGTTSEYTLAPLGGMQGKGAMASRIFKVAGFTLTEVPVPA